ncbi:amidinotransferase family protein [Gloeomargarita lithophora Alchichica-D10]|uniref:ornithine cyclodeaminase n=1 Tax=Gloeomargarita lithophora Alchichica-D10 TaxID=1188229 RepID=A0A1J0AAX6_9CYAN|nr:TIGR00300 family protein [Gloeomargarita lithophora]APB33061.1 amidinotransferase family protein [Gloeomargarita lithophora Alchichica-D10]
MNRLRYLMCPPDHYQVNYVINPWMEGNVQRSSQQRAIDQWQKLQAILSQYVQVERLTPAQGWPDMVFTANAGLIVNQTVVLSQFYHPERQGEQPYCRDWFAAQGYQVLELPQGIAFEGAGDALLDRGQGWLWSGYGFRSMLESHPYLAKWLSLEVLSLHLIDKRFYHLDTCFCPLSEGYLLYYPPAFDTYSNHLIERRIPPEKRIPVSEADAIHFACNAVEIDRVILANSMSYPLQERLQKLGFTVITTDLSEFLKAGGAAKCLTLRLDEPLSGMPALAGVTKRLVSLQGHLVDSDLLTEALDRISDGGGSFQIEQFNLGAHRPDPSVMQLWVSAPTEALLDSILNNLIDLGARLPDAPETPVRLERVTQPGVAPEDFYVTTIYPTEIYHQNQWLRVQNQRMDGVIVVTESAATCRLIRDLQAGDQVVCGVDGIHTLHKQNQERGQEFGFMESGVSSERRVELVVEEIAWELRRIRERGGKTVVVAGPVTIHTGGSPHLATLIREGYVQALLGGNAIAVHDLEQNLYGTSLGVDLARGRVVKGGHRHHLKTINLIRRYGSIEAAVGAGVITSGIFYECIRQGVPFSLAGSIRDDGPLPETRMDLLQAQTEYSQLIQGAEMILMLSTMLHSIGVGNMTPAGVKLICVDINPAVVTKLADRGSLESVGVVTDVGLFLSMLVRQLQQLGQPYSLTTG